MSVRAGWFVVAAVCLFGVAGAWAGFNGGFRGGAVGGISINTAGVLAQPAQADVKLARDTFRKELAPVPGELNQPVEIRKISLKAIEQAIKASGKNNVDDLPAEMRYLAGIQRVQYILLYPEQNDIVLAGPGEGWKVDDAANIVGVTTGRPVVRLEDLLVALRTVDQARQGGISVSIDPTPEGRRAFEQYISTQATYNPRVLDGIEKAMGDQRITITGVPDTSRFARMLVAADYKMKRIGMGLEPAPIAGLPSFIDMLKASGAKLDNMMPRWWIATSYQPLAKGGDGLSWEIRGKGVKVMTEDEIVAGGNVQGTGKVNPIAQKWADTMTAKYDELAAKEASFGDLRNIMDLCVAAALIRKEGLLEKAGCEIPTLLAADGQLGLQQWAAPKRVATQASALKRGKEWIITASGGVAISSWEAADKVENVPGLGEVRTKAAPVNSALWWN